MLNLRVWAGDYKCITCICEAWNEAGDAARRRDAEAKAAEKAAAKKVEEKGAGGSKFPVVRKAA